MTLLIIYLSVAIGISFLCSVMEAVLLSITPSFVEKTRQQNPSGSKYITKVKENLDESISSILILNTFAHTMGAAGVGAQATKIFGVRYEALVAVLLTLAILYFSEIIPKTLGAAYWRRLAVPATWLISWLVITVYPLVWVSTRLTRLMHKSRKNQISREEIIALASLGQKHGALMMQENEYLTNLLRLRDIQTQQILTPRSVVHWLEQTTTVKEALDQEQTIRFTRIPLYKGNTDHVSGLVINRHLLLAEREGNGDWPLEKFILPIDRVSEKLPVSKLLDFFIKKQEHLFLVEDEFGQCVGIVTLEDALETLLGKEIVDETDSVEDMRKLAKQNYRSRLRKNREDSD